MKQNLVLSLCVGSLFLASCSSVMSLEAPQNLRAVPGENKVELSWEDKSDNEAGFTVYRSLASETNFSKLEQTAANVENYTDSVDTTNSYVYQVRAFTTAGSESAPSLSQAVSATKLAAPSNLKATSGENKIELTWTDNSSIEEGFRIFRKLESDANFPTDATATMNANATNYIDIEVSADSSYVYQIIAFAGKNVSEISNTTAPATPTAPVNPNPTPQPIIETLKGEWKGLLEGVGDVELSVDEDLDAAENSQRHNARFTYLNEDQTRFFFECRVTGSTFKCNEIDANGDILGDNDNVITGTFTDKGKISGAFKLFNSQVLKTLTLSRVNP